MEEMIKYLETEHHKKLYITENGCELINHAQKMIARERQVILKENKRLIPGCQLQLVYDGTIDAFTTKIDEEYCIFVNKGVIEEQKTYLEELDWSFLEDDKREEYIASIVEYGFYFFVFHEYAHIFCGHNDAGLRSPADKKAQECEADMFSMDYLIKYIECYNPLENYTAELEKLFLAIYFLFENMSKVREEEWYNDKLIQNYYDEERIEKRKHPLSAQRILYLYEMLNIVVVTDKARLLPIKENIINKLKMLKGIAEKELPNKGMDYLIADESIQDLKKTVLDIQEKIPRIGNNQDAVEDVKENL
jgi:hypothetical protein